MAENTASGEKTILIFDSLQSVTAQDVAEGVTYLSVMMRNLKTLTEPLQ